MWGHLKFTYEAPNWTMQSQMKANPKSKKETRACVKLTDTIFFLGLVGPQFNFLKKHLTWWTS